MTFLRKSEDSFLDLGNRIVRRSEILEVYYGKLFESEKFRKQEITVFFKDTKQGLIVEGFDAIRVLWELSPTSLEGKHFYWAKNSWWFHNLVGHPVMQLLAFVGLTSLALKIHDKTVPYPKPVVADR